MPPADRKATEAADRAAARAARGQAKKARAEARKTATRAERRSAKRRERVYRKVKNRPRRLIGWTALGLVVVLICVAVAPTVGDVRRLLSIDIDTSTEAGTEARAYGVALAEEISDEGIVLLENEDDVLPLTSDTLNVFSFASFNMRYGGGGSGAGDQSAAVTLYDALEQQGISYNRDLKAAMKEAGAETKSGGGSGLTQILGLLTGSAKATEPAPDYLTESVLAQARDFADTALVVIGNDGVESADFTHEELRLTGNQRALLDTVTANFDDVVVVVNSGNQMELGFVEEYPQIKGAVWIGTPGPRGGVSLAKILVGAVNPSGHLTDTWAYDVASAPATENFGDYEYENAKRALLEYEEGIYVGYRYYETRFEGDETGYAAAVQYPFGHGLSYTTFDWRAAAPVLTGDEITVDVTVTNSGSVAGKDAVQVYYSAPYTPGGIEKTSIALAGYGKTALLAPGQSEVVSISFGVRDMASWDLQRGAYVLEAGSYGITIGTNVHTPVSRAEITVPKEIGYDTDAATGMPLENRFQDAAGELTYLSRADWEGTYPDDGDVTTIASNDVVAALEHDVEPVTGDAPTYGADNGIQLADLAGRDYDDPMWDDFLDQFTKDEQVAIFARGAYETESVERLGVPSAVLLDGPAGLNFFFGEVTAASFPTEVVIASTWNDDLAYAQGEAIGAEANAYGVHGWYATGMNIHRTPYGGRNFEYYSEDPLLSGRMAAAAISGAQSKNVLTFMKHFALNEQEVNARSGVNVWVDEQALREIYLKPFELSVKEGGATGAMTSFIHIGTDWSGGNRVLLQDVLRGEWGFDGVVTTDAVIGGFMDPALAVRNGNDLMLAVLGSSVVKATNAALDDDPAGVGHALRDRVHAVMFALLRTELFD